MDLSLLQSARRALPPPQDDYFTNERKWSGAGETLSKSENGVVRRFAGFPVNFLSTGSANLGKKAADRGPLRPHLGIL
jgi:hypothetical protein